VAEDTDTETEVVELSNAHSREELDQIAEDEGIEDPDDLPNKEAVARAIIEARAEGDDESSDDDEDEEDTDEEGEVIQGDQAGQAIVSWPSEVHPEKRPLEVDLKDVEPADYEGETMPPFNAETFVKLDGDSDEVPDELDGAIAAMIEWPVAHEHDHHTGVTLTYDPPDGTYIVKELSQGIRLSVTKDAFKEVSTNGRAGLVPFA
jgi:hypothetical protein